MLQNDGKPSLVEGFHNDRTHSLVVGEEVKGGKEEEQSERQAERNRKGKIIQLLKKAQRGKMLGITTGLTPGYQ